ncbi:MAG: TRAP transporter large permease [Desulfitobacteriaceae bacterium]|nr:TRAP transporter large permease [Desulfitobacteriaceae bacterium]MDD4752468.1 TRAP transporter large permease [Desulfitobacteriaceae bacterium]
MVLALFGLFIVLFLLNVPIGVALGISTILVLMGTDFTLYMIPQRMFSALDSTPLMAIPGFVFAGVLMSRGGISKYLISALKTYVGHLRGGLSVVTILACMIFAAISGSSPATAAAIGSIMIPGMVNAGYDKAYAMGLVAASGTLGILIPPSVPLIVYGVVAEESIGKLFMAGVLPGILLGTILVTAAIVYAKKHNYGGDSKATWKERWQATVKAIWGAVLPFLILGSIYTGICTPTEAAVVACFYTIIVSAFIYRELTFKDIRPILRETVNITSMIFLIIASAMLFALFLTNHQVPQSVANWISEANVNKWVFFLLTNLMFFVMGTFLEAVSIILITLPIFLPIVKYMGIDPVHFAIVMTVNMELAMITPPVGLNLFVVSGIAKEPLERVVRGVIPFIVLLIAVLALLVIFQDISLYLPSLMD